MPQPAALARTDEPSIHDVIDLAAGATANDETLFSPTRAPLEEVRLRTFVLRRDSLQSVACLAVAR